MKTDNLNLHELQSSTFKPDPASVKIGLHSVFADRNTVYLNECNLYLIYYGVIPNVITESSISFKRAHPWFVQNYRESIKDIYYNKKLIRKSQVSQIDDVFYFLDEDLMVNFDHNYCEVRLFFRATAIEKVDQIIASLGKFKLRIKSLKPEIFVLMNTGKGLNTRSLEISKPKLSIEDNYNDDFKPIHEIILKRLNKKNDKGLVLLHGKPGTGKTSYIRYLIASVKKSVIFLPPNMASAITNPDLITVLIDNPNSIFVIEDAENIVIDREKDGHSPVSALLNISDGLLSDCLNIQVICSFNTDISKIDSALMRKGRLIAKYEFEDLTVDKAKALSAKLGFENTIDSPMSLASIYNQNDQAFENKKIRPTIGFKASA